MTATCQARVPPSNRLFLFLLRMSLPESCHAADTLSSSSFTTPYPHSCDTFFSSRSPLCCPTPAFSGRFPHARAISQARETHHHLVHCHDLYVSGYFCPRFHLGCPPKLSVISRPHFSFMARLVSIPACHCVNPHVPWVNQRLCSTRVVPRSRRPRLGCRIGLYSTQKAPEF